MYVFIYFSNTIKIQNKGMKCHQKLCVHLLQAPLFWVYPGSPGEFVHPDSSEPLVPSQPPGVIKKGFTKNVQKSITDIILQYSEIQYSCLYLTWQTVITHLVPSGPVIDFWPTALLIPRLEESFSFVAVRLGRPFLPKKFHDLCMNYIYFAVKIILIIIDSNKK